MVPVTESNKDRKQTMCAGTTEWVEAQIQLTSYGPNYVTELFSVRLRTIIHKVFYQNLLLCTLLPISSEKMSVSKN